MQMYGGYQDEIYLNGVLRGIRPKLPVDFKSLEAKALAALPDEIVSYVRGGCGDERTQDQNVAAFDRWGLIPRMLMDGSARDMSITLFGLRLPSPVFMAPIGVIGICAQDGHGDLAVARASRQIGVPMTASTLSSDPLEDVAAELGDNPGFFQLYTPNEPSVAESLIHRAEAAGFKALIVTLDTWVTGWRPRDLNASNFPQLRGRALANYFSDPAFRALLDKPPEEDPQAAILKWAKVFGKSLTWDDLPWLRSLTKLPIVLKGICHPDDARRAIDAGVDAVYCSNHGGRQANGGVASLDMLPAVVDAVGDAPVLFDGGVRSGTDIVKALSLGAKAVGVGRPYAYGLALDGPAGIVHVLRSMYEAMVDAVAEAETDETIRAILFSGAGDGFRAGNDLNDFLADPPTGTDSPAFRFLRAISTAKKALLAAVHGAAVGIGTTMLLHCDLVVAAPSAKLSLPFVALGLVPEAASTLLLPRTIGHQRAAELLLLGQSIDAETALRWGLVNSVVEDATLTDVAIETVTRICSLPPAALRLSKQLLKDDGGDVAARIEQEAGIFTDRVRAPEFQEAASAFFERRAPDFSRFS